MRRHELSNEQWEKIKDLLPPERKPQGGRPAKNNRIMMNGIIYWLNTGVAWRANGVKKRRQKQKDVQEVD